MSARRATATAPAPADTVVRSIELDTALAKLARVLDVEPAEVDFLAHLPVADLRELRWEISDGLAAADAKRLAGVMAASKLVPFGIAATIGEKWFGPVLCAKLVGLVEPKRAGQYVKHLSVDFMADITTRTDPRVVGPLVQELDLRSMQRIATRLLERDDHLTLSHFVGHLPSPVVAAILEAIDDNAAVVRIARYVEDLDQLDPVVALLPDDRIVELVHAVADADLWVDALHLFSQLGSDQITRIAATIAQQDTDAVGVALDAFTRHDLWHQGIALVDHLAPDDLATLATVLVRLDQAVITSALDAFDRNDLWSAGIALVERLDPADLVAFADVLLVLDDAVIDRAVALIDAEDAWATLVRIALAADDLDDDVRARLRVVLTRVPKAKVKRFEAAAKALGHPDLLTTILAARS